MDESTKPSFSVEDVESQFSFGVVLLILLAAIVGALAGILILQNLLPGYVQSLSADQPKVFWYLTRSTAFIAYFLLWFSMILGVGVTNKLAARWPGLAKANDLHQFVSLLGLAFGLFHGLILMGDHYLNLSIVQVLLPFSMAQYRPVEVGIGQTAFYLWAIVFLSFYVRKRIGSKVWRGIHFGAYLILLGSLVHGLLGGTDAATLGATLFYWSTGGILLFLTVYRIFTGIAAASERKAKQQVRETIQTS